MSSPSNLPPPIPASKGDTTPKSSNLRHIPVAEGRRNSFSGQSLKSLKPQLPSEPASPSQVMSPRLRRSQHSSLVNRLRSLSDSENIEKVPNISQDRTNLILEILERNDVREMLYKRTDNCCIFPTDKNMNEKSFDEQKFMRREYPSYFSTDRQFFRFLMHQFSDALQGLEERYPHYFSINKLNDYQMEGLVNELDLWFTLFDECISQESQHSKINAYLMKTIMEVFQQDYLLLVNQVKAERKKYSDLIESNEIKEDQSETSKLRQQYEKTVSENERIKRENAKIQEELKKNYLEKFELKNQLDEAHGQINQLLETIDQLRTTISGGQERISELLREKPSNALEATFTAVPDDVLEAWTQCSQFLTAIMNDELTKLDFDSLFLDNMTKNDGTLGAFLTIPRPEVPTFTGPNVHFSKLIGLINMFKKNIQANTLFDLFQGKIRALFKKFSIFYVDRVLKHRKSDKEKEAKLKKQLKELRSSASDPNEWMKIVLDSPEFYSIPKKGAPNIQAQMLFVFQKSQDLMKNGLNKPRSAGEIIQKCYNGYELLLFLAQLSKLSNSDISADLFRQFVSRELPYHMYLYYSKIVAMNEKLDLFKRTALLNSQFKEFGFTSIPQQKRRHFESMYCASPVTFPIFVLAIYQHIVENIAIEITDKVKKNDLNSFLREKYDDDELCDYLLAISEKDDPSIIEYASLLFTYKKEKFPNALKNFDPQNSKLIDYMANFGKKKENEVKKSPKKKSRASSRSPSRHIRPSSNMGNEIPELNIQQVEENTVDAAENTNNEDGSAKNNAVLLEEEEEEKEVNVMIDINLPGDDDDVDENDE